MQPHAQLRMFSLNKKIKNYFKKRQQYGWTENFWMLCITAHQIQNKNLHNAINFLWNHKRKNIDFVINNN